MKPEHKYVFFDPEDSEEEPKASPPPRRDPRPFGDLQDLLGRL